jgi:hypothetical protein
MAGTRLPEDKIEYVMEAVDRGGEALNFADYLFLRKTNLAWKECAIDDKLAKNRVNCALAITSPGKTMYLPDSKYVFDLGWVLKEGVSDG